MTLQVLIVDDEALARARLRTLLGDCVDPVCSVVGEANCHRRGSTRTTSTWPWSCTSAAAAAR